MKTDMYRYLENRERKRLPGGMAAAKLISSLNQESDK